MNTVKAVKRATRKVAQTTLDSFKDPEPVMSLTPSHWLALEKSNLIQEFQQLKTSMFVLDRK